MISVKIQENNYPVEVFNFPGGEVNVRLPELDYMVDSITISSRLNSMNAVMATLLTIEAVMAVTPRTARIHLYLPYLPFARQDRRCSKGEALSLQVIMDMYVSTGIYSISSMDIHNSNAAYDCLRIAEGKFNNNVLFLDTHQYNILRAFVSIKNYNIILPDKGSIAKYYSDETYHIVEKPKVIFDKKRDLRTGVITSIEPTEEYLSYQFNTDKEYIIIDDICDGGRTFWEIAKYIKEMNPSVKISLYITHGIFSAGFDTLLSYFDRIYTTNSWQSIQDMELLNGYDKKRIIVYDVFK